MDQTNTTDLTPLEFLYTVGAALASSEGWNNSEDLWVEYAEKADILDDRRCTYGI